MIYQNYNKPRFHPKRPVRSFRDLEVYQEAQQMAVIVVKNIVGKLNKEKIGAVTYPFLDEILNMSLDIPRIIADAHGARFDSKPSGLDYLDQAMKYSNKIIVYLEQVKAIYGDILDQDIIEELIRRYIRNRGKIFRLYQAWKRFLEKDKDQKG